MQSIFCSGNSIICLRGALYVVSKRQNVPSACSCSYFRVQIYFQQSYSTDSLTHEHDVMMLDGLTHVRTSVPMQSQTGIGYMR